MEQDVCIIGAGLAGSEAAWQLAARGHKVLLVEMRPETQTPAHQTGYAAEMVCSNSFKSDDPLSATGILKAEMELLGSLILASARETAVPAGQSLAVDRALFAKLVTEKLRGNGNIIWKTKLAEKPPLTTLYDSMPTILASGPLTAGPLAEWISSTFDESCFYFYDAIAPIVERDSIDMSIAFPASRYGKGPPDFLNCPLNKEQYDNLLDAMLAAPQARLHDFDARFFESCLPIEVMAERGRDTLRYGPMKPVGLTDPRTGRWPYAAVQLRQDSVAADMFNMVGFQTRMAQGAQAQVLRLIPGLENAIFARYGSIHRNTYICAPRLLDATLEAKAVPRLFFAGQLSGAEGYLESAATGLAAAIAADRKIKKMPPLELPRQTMMGSLLHYLANAEPNGFAPMNAMMGLLPELPEDTFDAQSPNKKNGAKSKKAVKRALMRERALAAIKEFVACC